MSIFLFACAGKFPRPALATLPIAEPGDKITIEYEANFANGSLFDRSADYDVPVTFTLGQREVFPGIEKTVLGMKPGEKKKVLLTPEAAYGLHDPAKVELIPLEEFPSGFHLRKGMLLPAKSVEGESVQGKVLDVSPEGVTVDFNHPLAGESLWMEIRVKEIAKEAKLR